MITRDALYDFIETLVDNADPSSALFDAASFRNLRGSVDTKEDGTPVKKVVRVEVFVGQHCMTTEDKKKELNVEATIQCWVTPESEGDELANLDQACDDSFDMSRELFEAMAANTNLNGLVCDSYFDEFETGTANLGSFNRGVTYLDGTINQAS
jgi:hypothetical protein